MRNLGAQLALDAVQAWRPRQVVGLAVFGAAFMFLGGDQDGPLMATMPIALIPLLASTASFIADRDDRLDFLSAQLPVTRRTIVASHYLIGAAAFAVTVVVVLGIATALRPEDAEARSLAALTLAGIATIAAVAMPAIARFGRQSLLFVTFGLSAVGLLAARFLPPAADALGRAVEWSGTHALETTLLAAAALALLWAASYAVTAAIYQRRDY